MNVKLNSRLKGEGIIDCFEASLSDVVDADMYYEIPL